MSPTAATPSVLTPTTSAQVAKCLHCQRDLSHADKFSQQGFCCGGCQAAFQLLSKSESASGSGFGSGEFHYLDTDDFKNEIKLDRTLPMIEFYLEGVQCSSCLWKIESLPQKFPRSIVAARLDMGKSVVRITATPDARLSEIAETLKDMGYQPHPLMESDQARTTAQKTNRKALLRIGIAGAFAGNIMLFSVAIYAGATGVIRDHFDVLTLFLSLPVFFYSAVPLYRSAFESVRLKKWSVDLPITIALFSGFVISAHSVLTNGNQNYLDSLSALVLFLLSSRYWLSRLQDNAYQGLQLMRTQYPEPILRIRDGVSSVVSVKELRAGDIIEVAPFKTLPVDGVLIGGRAQLNSAMLTGEATPSWVLTGDMIFQGMKNLDDTLRVKVTQVGEQTRLEKMISEIRKFRPEDHPVVRWSERAAKVFSYSILVLSIVIVMGSVLFSSVLFKADPWTVALQAGVYRMLMVWIVSCPCALAFATPLVLIRAYQIALKNGVYIKNPAILDKARSVRNVVFDKTGTLTEGAPQVVEAIGDWQSHAGVLYALVSDSSHPVSKAIMRWLESSVKNIGQTILPKLIHVQETPGVGVRASDQGTSIVLERNESWTSLLIDQQVVASFVLRDELKDDAKELVRSLVKAGKDVWILSGDSEVEVMRIAEQLPVPKAQVRSRMTPDEKADFVEKLGSCLFVGDGVNDGLALKKATIGVAAHGAFEISLQAADLYLTEQKLSGVKNIFDIACVTDLFLKRNFIFTVVYNFTLVTLAVTGQLSPLIAAIAMPLSSLTVLTLSYLGRDEAWVRAA